MSDDSAQWWAGVRSKGKSAYIFRSVLIETFILILGYILFWMLDWASYFGVLIIWFVFGIVTSFRSWSDYEDQYSKWEVARIVNGDPNVDIP